ncbi:carbohydrate ABC transporter permease [Cryobacterium breve]|uniref:carbohydrate ABC transporter permease n=1 Tax=Cryobacterium breve TaxID=1259258 RepID=UPI003D7C17A1
MTSTHAPTAALTPGAATAAPASTRVAARRAAATSVAPKYQRRPRTISQRREERSGFAMLAPAVLLLLLFIAVPAVLAFGLAFTNARLISPYPASFVGLDNFTRLLGDDTFYRALLNVGYFALVVVPLQAGLALVMAILLNTQTRGTAFFRTVYFLPVVTSMVVVSLLWMFMYRQDGLINVLISNITFGQVTGPDWLNNPATSMPAIILMSVWQGVGFHMIIWLSGLQTISGESLRSGRHRRGLPLATLPLHHLAGTARHTQPRAGHHHHRSAEPLHPGQRNDPGRSARLDDDRRLRSRPGRVRTTGNVIRVRHLARVLRDRARHRGRATLPHQREGLTWLSMSRMHPRSCRPRHRVPLDPDCRGSGCPA